MPRLIISEIMRRKRLSKRQLAKRLGIDYSNVFRLFRAGSDPKFSTLVRLAKAIGCRVRDLIRE